MTSSPREQLLERVRQALAEGNRAGATPALEPRGDAGYQGAGADPVSRFCQELTAAGGQAHVVADTETAIAAVLGLVRAAAARRVLLGRGAVLDKLDLPHRLDRTVEVTLVDRLGQTAARDALFAADLGISGVAFLVAETGSVVVQARPDEPRSLSLLPPVHIAVAERSQIVPDLFDLFAALGPDLPSCLTVITGPSKTGDIELRLVTGVHGPGHLHVVLIDH
jgi:L-lactate dehydrogenase complex protein LldG